jgi:hypothetical protein
MLLGKLKLDPCLSLSTKINSWWIKDLNIKPESLKQLEEAVGNTLEQIGIGNNFLKQNSKGSASKRNNEQKGLS